MLSGDLRLLTEAGYIVRSENPLKIVNGADGGGASGLTAEAIVEYLRMKAGRREKKPTKPIILVFYGMYVQEEFDLINKYLASKKIFTSEVLSFFIPSERKRLECINPVLLSDDEFEDVKNKLERIREIFEAKEYKMEKEHENNNTPATRNVGNNTKTTNLEESRQSSRPKRGRKK